MHRVSVAAQNHSCLILQMEEAILFSLKIHHLLVDSKMHYSPIFSIHFVVQFPEKSSSYDLTKYFDLALPLIV